MNRLDDAVVAALRNKADDAAQRVDATRARAAVEVRLDRIDRRRGRRVWLVLVAVGAMAAIVALVVFAGRNLPHSALPPAHPSPTNTWLTLSRDPFLAASGTAFIAGLVRDPNVQARPLSPCLPDPHGWGAIQVESAAYRSPTDPKVAFNEYVLRFADPAAAHHAIEEAWARLHTCPSANFLDLRAPGLSPDAPYLKDIVAGETSATRDFYVPRIGRAGNVVVVLEGTGEVDDRSSVVLDRAMSQATPEYAAFGPKTWP